MNSDDDYVKCFMTGGRCTRSEQSGNLQKSQPAKVDSNAKEDAGRNDDQSPTGPNNVQCLRHDREKVNPNNKVFVIMPFKEKYFDNFKFGIEKYYSKEKYDCKHGALSKYVTGEYIICNICGEIQSSSLVIADVSDANPNVYYELGIAHGLGKEVIILHDDSCSENPIIKLLKKVNLVRPYHNIRDINEILSMKGENLLRYELIDKGKSDNFNVACLIPDDLTNQTRSGMPKPKFSEVFEIAIKDSIKGINLFRQRRLNVGEIKNIVSNVFCGDIYSNNLFKKKIAETISYIIRTRYFIIDFTEARLEVLYWLGFIHGLRVNREIPVKEATYIYIAQEDPEKLPFDIRANKIIHYKSLRDLSKDILVEIERLEKDKIHMHHLNQAKYRFWHSFNFINTRFIFGSDYMLQSEPFPKEYIVAVNVNDFKAFNRLRYIISFLQEQTQLMYDIKIPVLLDLISSENQDRYETLNKTLLDPCCLGKLYTDIGKLTDKNDLLKRCGFINNDEENGNDEEKNYIIIGPSYVNIITEIIFRSLYDDKNKPDKHYGYTFKTIKDYKLKSRFWAKMGTDDNTIGIYVPKNNKWVSAKPKTLNDFDPICKYELPGEIKQDFVLQKDFGLLLFFKNLEVFSKKIRGNFIVLCGFSKYGTYGLGRMISNYTIKNDNNDNKDDEEEKIYLKGSRKGTTVNELLSVVNEVIGKKDEYCIEVVIEFEYEGFKDKFEEKFVEGAKKKLMAFHKYDRENHRRENLMGRV